MGYWKEGDELNKGKYLVEQLLGSGGFGVTYRIREKRTNKLYALKTLNEIAKNQPDFPQLQSKFINEAIALASCRHKNIVKVYPQGFQEGELWCMVMEYVEGVDLSRHLDQNGKFAEARAVKIINKVGEALSFVHQNGLLHRDIKPANILLRSSDSTPVLIDFGLAREYNANPDSIRSMTNSMTESFAPIEQYQRHGKFGAWTDVYALAATLYVLVTKELPFPAKFRSHVALVPPKKHNHQVSDRINEAILKGLELQPSDRPQTVKAWLGMLKPPQPKPKPQPPEQPKYTEPQPKPIVTRRIWLKYSGLAISSMVFALVGKEVIDYLSKSTQPQITGNKPETQSIENGLELKEYEFDVITVNDKGEEINREQGQAKYFREDLGNEITLEMVEIAGGTFTMGSPESEVGREEDESPQHKVTVPSFYMAKYEVTQVQWEAVARLPQIEIEIELDSSKFKGDDLPVEQVSWYDAVEFCARLSKATGKEYRLPSEAEWEYACRAGTTTPFHFGETITTDLANYNVKGPLLGGSPIYSDEPWGKYREKTTPVDSFSSNAFGLYDMHGNVWEWCADSFSGGDYNTLNNNNILASNDNDNNIQNIVRGGSWFRNPQDCRSANRGWIVRSHKYHDVSFRCIASRTL